MNFDNLDFDGYTSPDDYIEDNTICYDDEDGEMDEELEGFLEAFEDGDDEF